MAEVKNTTALLIMALQDLHDGELALEQRLGAVRDNARDGEFRGLIEDDRDRSIRQRETLAMTARSLGGEPQDQPNIWLRAILDDADNDARTITPGPLRDTALVGALRKGKQAERVSYETAMALARRLKLDEAANSLARIRDEEQEADDQLAALLERLTSRELDA